MRYAKEQRSVLWQGANTAQVERFPIHLFVIIIIHHVPKQHGHQAPKEGAERLGIDRGFAESAPELAALQGYTLVPILQPTEPVRYKK